MLIESVCSIFDQLHIISDDDESEEENEARVDVLNINGAGIHSFERTPSM